MDIEMLREFIDYDPTSGEMRWKKVLSNRAVLGGICGGNTDSKGYARVCIGRRQYRAHRIAWALFYGTEPGGLIDHINGDRLDNRIANLRLATDAQNARNARIGRDNTSGVIGVVFHKRAKKWVAQITVNYKNLYLGLYPDIETATTVRRAAEQKYFGSFAPTR